jgi:hypothetical protein
MYGVKLLALAVELIMDYAQMSLTIKVTAHTHHLTILLATHAQEFTHGANLLVNAFSHQLHQHLVQILLLVITIVQLF